MFGNMIVAALQRHRPPVAHQADNSAKSDHLAAIDYLIGWAERNVPYRDQLASEFDDCRVRHELPTTARDEALDVFCKLVGGSASGTSSSEPSETQKKIPRQAEPAEGLTK